MSNGLGYAFTRKYIIRPGPWVKVTQNVTQYPLHHMAYAFAKFEIATNSTLGLESFTRKYIIWPWPWGVQGHKTLPSTLYIMWPLHLQRLKLLKRRCIYKKYIIWPLPWPSWSRSHKMLPSSLHASWKFEVATSNGWRGDAFTRKYILWPWRGGQGHMTTSCDLCTCKVWSCYV